MTKPSPMHPEQIKAIIRMRYGSQLAFETAHGLAKRAITDHNVNGKKSHRTAEALASELQMSIHDLFPGRYKSSVEDNSCPGRRMHRLNRKALRA